MFLKREYGTNTFIWTKVSKGHAVMSFSQNHFLQGMSISFDRVPVFVTFGVGVANPKVDVIGMSSARRRHIGYRAVQTYTYLGQRSDT